MAAEYLCTIHIYDETSRFLDFVCERMAKQIFNQDITFFVSYNISLEVLLKTYNSVPGLPRLIYTHNLYYKSTYHFFNTDDLISSLQRSLYPGKLARTCFIIDFGSFCSEKYSVQEILELYSQFQTTGVEIMFCFDCRLLSPNELSYIVSLSPVVYVNNILIQKKQSATVRIPLSVDVKNVNSIINQHVLDLIVKLAQSTSGSVDVHKELSELRMSNAHDSPRTTDRRALEREMENSFLVSDQDAESMEKTNSYMNLINRNNSGVMRRVNSKRGSMLNLNFYAAKKQESEKTINITFNANMYQLD